MRICKALLTCFLLFTYSAAAYAKDCNAVLALSRQSDRVVETSATLMAHADAFCSQYKSVSTASANSSFGASYKFLSASTKSGNASMEEVASLYCSSTSSNAASSNGFEKYVESIAPGAYGAYEACLKAKDLSFTLGPVLDNEFSMIAIYEAVGGFELALRANPSAGVTCQWDADPNAQEAIVKSNGTAVLNCKRSDVGKKAYVVVTAKNGLFYISIPWQAFTPEGAPLDLVKSLRDEVAKVAKEGQTLRDDNLRITAELASTKALAASVGTGVETGVITAKAHNSYTQNCPSGSYVRGFKDVGTHGEGLGNSILAFSLVCSTLR